MPRSVLRKTFRPKLETVLEVPECSLDSPANSPRLHVQHTHEECWYSDDATHCQKEKHLRHMHQSLVPCEAAKDQVPDHVRQDLDTALAVPECLLESPENSPRLQMEHTDDEFWYSETKAACQQVLNSRCMHESQAPREAAKGQVQPHGQWKEVPEYSVESPTKHPRLHMQHTDDDFWCNDTGFELDTLLKAPTYFAVLPEHRPIPHMQRINGEHSDMKDGCPMVLNLGHMHQCQVLSEAAREQVLDSDQQELTVASAVPEYLLDSPGNSPRLPTLHKDDEFWYSDVEAHCQHVLNPMECVPDHGQQEMDAMPVVQEYFLDSPENSPIPHMQRISGEGTDAKAACQVVLNLGHMHQCQVPSEAAKEQLLDSDQQELGVASAVPLYFLDSPRNSPGLPTLHKDDEFWYSDVEAHCQQVWNPKECVSDHGHQEMDVMLVVQEHFLDSPEKSPRLHTQHKSDEFWYSDIEHHCQEVLNLGEKLSQDERAASNHVCQIGLQNPLKVKAAELVTDSHSWSDSKHGSQSFHRTLLSHLVYSENSIEVVQTGMHTVVLCMSSMALTVSFMLLTLLVCVENCFTWREHSELGNPSNMLTSLETFCDYSDVMSRAVGEWSPRLATWNHHPTELIQQLWLVIIIAVFLFVLALIHERGCKTHKSTVGSPMECRRRSSKRCGLYSHTKMHVVPCMAWPYEFI